MTARFAAWLFLLMLTAQVAAQVQSDNRPLVLIAYYSERGNTEKLAKAISEGATDVGTVRVVVLPVTGIDESIIRAAAALIVGSPVYNAAVAPPVQEFINSWPFDGTMRNKIGAAFSTGGGISAGEEHVMMSILQSMLVFGMIVVGGEDWKSAFGASGITEEPPFHSGELEPQFIEKGRALGRRVAELTMNVRR
ncbi:MAG: flavodoxin family protein [Ignavibacteriales bacterium]|nr:flavodoxin family protein [Ignavibacteriales bacterium]